MNNNDVFQVLVVSNPTILGAGGLLETLAVGQLGLFNSDTNLSITTAAKFPNKIFFAVGLPNDLGTLGDIRKSSGEYIKTSLISQALSQTPVTGSPQVTTLDFADTFIPVKATDYVIRFNFMNASTLMLFGFNNPVKSYTIHTNNLVAPSISEFQDLIVAEVNNDIEELVVAAKVGTTVTFTVAAEDKVTSIGGLNPKYHFLRQFKIATSLSVNFTDSVCTLTTVDPVYEQNSGYDLQQLEYVAGGWIGNPGVYRESELTGLIGYSIDIFAVAATNYWTLRLTYGHESHSGGNLPFNNELETIIAVPYTSSYVTLINKLVVMMNTYNSVSGTVVNILPTTTSTTTGTPTTTTTTTAAATTTTTTTVPVTTTTTT